MKLVETGYSISLEMAKAAIQAAEAEALANNWAMIIVVVDSGGHLVAMERMNNAMLGAIDVAHSKARTASLFKRPTKVYEEVIGNDFPGRRLLAIKEICPIEGGVPIMYNGIVVGAIGVSGGQSSQDGQVAAAGLKAIEE